MRNKENKNRHFVLELEGGKKKIGGIILYKNKKEGGLK
jgi:hypothetical protein